MKFKVVGITILMALFTFGSAGAVITPTTIAWDANDDNGKTIGYEIFYRSIIGDFPDAPAWNGPESQCTLQLETGVYFVAVKAFDIEGNRSVFSEEIRFEKNDSSELQMGNVWYEISGSTVKIYLNDTAESLGAVEFKIYYGDQVDVIGTTPYYEISLPDGAHAFNIVPITSNDVEYDYYFFAHDISMPSSGLDPPVINWIEHVFVPDTLVLVALGNLPPGATGIKVTMNSDLWSAEDRLPELSSGNSWLNSFVGEVSLVYNDYVYVGAWSINEQTHEVSAVTIKHRLFGNQVYTSNEGTAVRLVKNDFPDLNVYGQCWYRSTWLSRPSWDDYFNIDLNTILPFSVGISGKDPCLRADIDGNGLIDGRDYNAFAQLWFAIIPSSTYQ